jgi:hypothetical protein
MAEERINRKLAAILAADVVGYSRLSHWSRKIQTEKRAELFEFRWEVFLMRADHSLSRA